MAFPYRERITTERDRALRASLMRARTDLGNALRLVRRFRAVGVAAYVAAGLGVGVPSVVGDGVRAEVVWAPFAAVATFAMARATRVSTEIADLESEVAHLLRLTESGAGAAPLE